MYIRANATVRRKKATMIECPADEFIPLPTGQSKLLDYGEVRRRAVAACNTAGALHKEGHTPTAQPEAKKMRGLAQEILNEAAKGHPVPAEKVRDLVRTPESAIFVKNILTQYDMEIVQEAKRLRNYVTNKLILESDNMDARIRMRALELLGKISDVGLFTERTEITVNNRSTVELENSLREKVRRLMGTADAEEATIIAEPLPPKNIDAVSALQGL